MLKKLALFFTSILFLAACKPSTSDSYKITCVFSGENNNPIILSLFDGKKAVSLDTVMSTEEIYTFKYGIRYIPSTYLLNKEGVIIGVNLVGESLQKKLEEIFN